jgi:hypothetical protein
LALALSRLRYAHKAAKRCQQDSNHCSTGPTFANWKLPDGDNGHWKIKDGVIDYDAESEAQDKNLWTDKEYKDFILYVDWRIKETPWKNQNVPLILPSGLHKLDENGKPIAMTLPDSDSGNNFARGW